MPSAWTHRPLWIALSSVGVAGIAALVPSAEQLSTGGLAIPLAAVIAAVVLGLAVASVERRASDEPSRALTVANSTGELALTVAAGAAAAPLVASLGWFGVMLAALAWSTVAVADGSLRVLASVGAIIAILAAIVGGVAAAATGVAWTLLEPPTRLAFVELRGWIGMAVVMGTVLAAAGFGHWSHPHNGHRRTPIAVIGLGLFVMLGLMVRHASGYDTVGLGGTDDLAMVLTLAVAVTAILAVGWRAGGPHPVRGAIGLGATLLFAWPAFEALPLWWTVLLPLAISVGLGARALTAHGSARIAAWVLAAAFVGVAWLGWPGLPGPLAAAAVALIPVVGLWVTGTRVLRVGAT